MKCFNRLFFSIGIFFFSCQEPQKDEELTRASRPNILIAISDDQSFPHVSVHGSSELYTPNFDRVAREGVRFLNAFASSPGCSPSRASLLTGRHTWQIGAAGTHASHFDTAYVAFPDLLERAGYRVGFTGKGWGPGKWELSGRKRNPAGPEWNRKNLESPQGISAKDYAGNFEEFLKEKPKNQPFYFWFGGHEPHRVFKEGIGKEKGKDLEKIEVPGFLPDNELIKSDIADYYVEIEWFDEQLGKMLNLLEAMGELDNTLILVTSDNGMAFPRAKANLYEYGFHVPMAIRWGDRISGNYISKDLVSFVDIAPTLLDVAQVSPDPSSPMVGNSLKDLLLQQATYKKNHLHQAIYSARERHSSSRYHSLSYPQRALRTADYLYIHNYRPERWPAGAPQKYGKGNYPLEEDVLQKKLGPAHGAYHDIDPCPSLDYLIAQRDKEDGKYFHLAIDHRPMGELFDIQQDPACLNNLALLPEYSNLQDSLENALRSYLKATGDPRELNGGDVWETYPRYSRLRKFPIPTWAKKMPEKIPDQDWLR